VDEDPTQLGGGPVAIASPDLHAHGGPTLEQPRAEKHNSHDDNGPGELPMLQERQTAPLISHAGALHPQAPACQSFG
jgi:hypothetical protein